MSGLKNQGLFEQVDKTYFLHTIHNGKKIDFEFDRIFDSTVYDSLCVVTYVSSPSFFFKKIKNFKKIDLILGIEDNDIASKFLFDPKTQNDFFKDIYKLGEKTGDEILSRMGKDINIFFANIRKTIHSKIYILKDSVGNSKTGARVIVGSANFTESAFSDRRQFEELLIFDEDYDKNIVENYMKRFDEILKTTVDFIPERIKNVKSIEEIKVNIINLNNENFVESIKENVNKINSSIFYIDEDLSEDIGLLENKEKESEKEIETIKTTHEIIKAITKQSKGNIIFIQPKEIEKKKDIIIGKINNIETVKKDFVDNRVAITFDYESRSLVKEDVSGIAHPYPVELSEDEIKRKMIALDKFISAYSKFTTHDEKNSMNRHFSTSVKIFEGLLYAFSSHYIWLLRSEYSKIEQSEEIKRYMPIFMVIAGQTGTGKTQLLKFISHSVGNLGNYYKFNVGSKMTNTSDINAQAIFQLIHTNNVTPIFVDEINKDYFSSASSLQSSYKGETFIKTATNNNAGIYPCLISTCNTDFTADAQVIKRIKYIQINNPFNDSKRDETSKYFNEVVEEFGSELHRDFCFRFENIVKDGLDKFNYDDILSVGRGIFKKYTEMCFKSMPEWYNEKKIDDYYVRGRNIWESYYNQRRKGFKFDSGHILIDDAVLFGSDMSSSGKRKDAIQYLPHTIILESKGIIKLDKNRFLEFIYGNSKRSLFRKIFKKMQSS